MATLTTLGAASPLNASDNTYHTFAAQRNGSASFALDNIADTDFVTMDTLTVDIECALTGTGDDGHQLLCKITRADGTTLLASGAAVQDTIVVVSNVTNTTDAYSGPVAFTTVDTSATRADWDGALLEIGQFYSRSGTRDGNAIRVDHVRINGTYTPTAGTDFARSALVAESSTVSALASVTTEFQRSALVAGSSTAAALASVERGRSALVSGVSVLAAAASVSRGRSAAVTSASTISAAALVTTQIQRSATVSGVSFVGVLSGRLDRGRLAMASGASTVAALFSVNRGRRALAASVSNVGAAASVTSGLSRSCSVNSASNVAALRSVNRGRLAMVSSTSSVSAAANTTTPNGSSDSPRDTARTLKCSRIGIGIGIGM